ncbi:hypothetical protein B0T16DRAFT_2737 [Cercophora newfieldiana]|uniref:Uncharacterized protein n=1 Tax=Cercophora newfieldiana TaxID=92897 RepID=A0AA39YLW5_9PEZI|nr:hypothetical protein B0T16DRAFT_2737 [Cercophora newfieldiana]
MPSKNKMPRGVGSQKPPSAHTRKPSFKQGSIRAESMSRAENIKDGLPTNFHAPHPPQTAQVQPDMLLTDHRYRPALFTVGPFTWPVQTPHDIPWFPDQSPTRFPQLPQGVIRQTPQPPPYPHFTYQSLLSDRQNQLRQTVYNLLSGHHPDAHFYHFQSPPQQTHHLQMGRHQEHPLQQQQQQSAPGPSSLPRPPLPIVKLPPAPNQQFPAQQPNSAPNVFDLPQHLQPPSHRYAACYPHQPQQPPKIPIHQGPHGPIPLPSHFRQRPSHQQLPPLLPHPVPGPSNQSHNSHFSPAHLAVSASLGLTPAETCSLRMFDCVSLKQRDGWLSTPPLTSTRVFPPMYIAPYGHAHGWNNTTTQNSSPCPSVEHREHACEYGNENGNEEDHTAYHHNAPSNEHLHDFSAVFPPTWTERLLTVYESHLLGIDHAIADARNDILHHLNVGLHQLKTDVRPLPNNNNSWMHAAEQGRYLLQLHLQSQDACLNTIDVLKARQEAESRDRKGKGRMVMMDEPENETQAKKGAGIYSDSDSDPGVNMRRWKGKGKEKLVEEASGMVGYYCREASPSPSPSPPP